MILAPDSKLVTEMHPSPNYGPRRDGLEVSMLVLHYTGLADVAKAIDWLSRPESKVSCHYVIDVDGRITQMVAEAMRAWHAGVSSWARASDINSMSVGIEIHNAGHSLGYPDFPSRQMRAVRDLSLEIVARHAIRPERVLAHSDVAPSRKTDPGEKLDWAWLARAGVGHWVKPEPVREDGDALALGAEGLRVAAAQSLLGAYGYGIEPTGAFDIQTEFVAKAFQRHFRPALVDGRIDVSTVVTLERLLEALPAAEVA